MAKQNNNLNNSKISASITEEKTSWKNAASPHFWWLISILSSAIIGLVAFICTCRVIDNETLLTYISAAATLLSITLSVFAIIYTYTSNDNALRQFEKINAAAELMNKAAMSNQIVSKKIDAHIDEIIGQLNNIQTQIGTFENPTTKIDPSMVNTVAKIQ